MTGGMSERVNGVCKIMSRKLPCKMSELLKSSSNFGFSVSWFDIDIESQPVLILWG